VVATGKAVAMDVVQDRAWDRAQAGATATMTTNGKGARAAAAAVVAVAAGGAAAPTRNAFECETLLI
jgi:hypothetical protein